MCSKTRRCARSGSSSRTAATIPRCWRAASCWSNACHRGPQELAHFALQPDFLTGQPGKIGLPPPVQCGSGCRPAPGSPASWLVPIHGRAAPAGPGPWGRPGHRPDGQRQQLPPSARRPGREGRQWRSRVGTGAGFSSWVAGNLTTKVPPFRPRLVSTTPWSRRAAKASRRVAPATPNISESSASTGSRSPTRSMPSDMAVEIRRTMASERSISGSDR